MRRSHWHAGSALAERGGQGRWVGSPTGLKVVSSEKHARFKELNTEDKHLLTTHTKSKMGHAFKLLVQQFGSKFCRTCSVGYKVLDFVHISTV